MTKHNAMDVVKGIVLPLAIFIALAFCSHAIFFTQFLGGDIIAFGYVGGDETSQFLAAGSLVERSLLNGDLFWSWEYGLGGDVYGEFSYYYSTSPFFYFMFLVKCLFGVAGTTDYYTAQAWHLVASVIKQILCMGLMFALQRQEGRSRLFACCGAILYGCCCWYLDNSFAFDFMTDAMIWPPLIVMGYNRFKAKGKWGCLVASVALCLANNFYFAYIIVIFLIIFALIFSVPSASQRKGQLRGSLLRNYGKNVGILAIVFAVAMLVAAIAFLPSVGAFLSADRTQQSTTFSFLPTLETLAMLPDILFYGGGAASHPLLQTFAFPVALFLVPFISFKKAEEQDALTKKTVLAIALVVLGLIPAFSSLMNGLSYPTNHWRFLEVFAVAYAFPLWMETLVKQKRVNGFALLWTLALIALMILSEGARRAFGMEESGYNFLWSTKREVFYFALQFIFVLGLFALCRTKSAIAPALRISCGVLFVLPVLLSMPYGPALLLAGETLYQPGVYVWDSAEDFTAYYCGSENSQAAYEELSSSEEEEFGRVLDVEATTNRTVGDHEARAENRSWLMGTYSTTAYNSMINKTVHRGLRVDWGVASTVNSASQYRGLGNRLFLESAWGVGYKINTLNYTSLYGYEEEELSNGATVYRNNYNCGLDVWYSSTISADQWDDLTYAQRDALLLQAAEVEGTVDGIASWEGDASSTVTALDLSDLDVTCEDCSLSGTAEELTIEVSGESGSLSFSLPEIEGEYLLSFQAKNPYSHSMSFYVNNEQYHLNASDSQWQYDCDIYTMSIQGSAGKVEILLPEGTYTVKNCMLEENSYEYLDQWYAQANSCNLENVTMGQGKVSGTVDATESGILALSTPYSTGWHCLVDGQEVEVLEVNKLFPGIEVEPGQHEITFYYTNRWFTVGAAVTVVTVLVLVAACAIRRYRRKNLQQPRRAVHSRKSAW